MQPSTGCLGHPDAPPTLLQTGCHVWQSSPPFDHSKLMTIDGEWSLIGSANWDTRSLRLNFELTVEFYDRDLSARLAEIIDAKRADEITLEEIDKRWFIVKLWDAAVRLSMPIFESRLNRGFREGRVLQHPQMPGRRRPHPPRPHDGRDPRARR